MKHAHRPNKEPVQKKHRQRVLPKGRKEGQRVFGHDAQKQKNPRGAGGQQDNPQFQIIMCALVRAAGIEPDAAHRRPSQPEHYTGNQNPAAQYREQSEIGNLRQPVVQAFQFTAAARWPAAKKGSSTSVRERLMP